MKKPQQIPNTERAPIVPAGAFVFPVNTPPETRHIGFLLLPEFTLLAFSSAVDPLRIANQLAQKPLFRWTIYSEDGRNVQASSGLSVAVDEPLEALPNDQQLLVCSGNGGAQAASQATIASLRRHTRFGGTVGGICTGAMTLARAGLLEGRRFTLHWENQPGFVETFPELEPSSSRVEMDGDLWTCGGGVAGAEMMLTMIREHYGRDFAILVSDMCLNGGDVAPRLEQRSSIAGALSVRNPVLAQILNDMHHNIEEPLTLAALAERAGLSRRQMERHFQTQLNQSPLTAYRNIRLDRARALFFETDMSVGEIAVACGFTSRVNFTGHYKERFGSKPSSHRTRREN